jgi:uncharacterized Zn finger protein (UPF0148 family)
MSDQRNTSPADSGNVMFRPSEPPTTERQSLRCQWCAVPLATGTTICPTCGSAGIPDPRMTVASLADSGADQPVQAGNAVTAVTVGNDVELVEWWQPETPDGELAEESRNTLDFDAVERRRTQSLMVIGGAGVVCALLGWLIGPSLLESPFERLTGATVEDPADLRTMGTIGGVIAGLFIGATCGWVIWSDN